MPIVKDVAKVDGQEIEIYVDLERLPEQEVYDPYSDTRDIKEVARRALTEVEGVFGEGLRLARSCAVRTRQILTTMKEEGTNPDEFEVQFSVKLDAGVPAIVQGGGHLQVTMKWKNSADDNGKIK